MTRLRHRPRVLLVMSASVLVAVLAAGAGLEAWLRKQEGGEPMRWGWKDPFALAGKRPAAEINQLGYRGQAIAYGEGDDVVLLVGDSQVQADACAFSAMPERRLETHLS